MPRTLNQSYPELVKKAQYLFWMKGFKAVSNDDLVKHLNVSKSTIYNKYTKDMLFMDALNDYVVKLSDPVLAEVRNSNKGMETFTDFFYMLIDGLLNKTFPKSCLMVNTVVELRNEQKQVTEVYERYFGNMKASYKAALERAIAKNELKYPEKIDEYTEFLLGIIFGLAILYKTKTRDELRTHIGEQLSFIE